MFHFSFCIWYSISILQVSAQIDKMNWMEKRHTHTHTMYNIQYICITKIVRQRIEESSKQAKKVSSHWRLKNRMDDRSNHGFKKANSSNNDAGRKGAFARNWNWRVEIILSRPFFFSMRHFKKGTKKKSALRRMKRIDMNANVFLFVPFEICMKQNKIRGYCLLFTIRKCVPSKNGKAIVQTKKGMHTCTQACKPYAAKGKVEYKQRTCKEKERKEWKIPLNNGTI